MRSVRIILRVLSVFLIFVACGDDEEAASGATFAVSYNANGATEGNVPEDSLKYSAGQTVTVLGNSGNLILTNHVFAGWTNAAGALYAESATFSVGSSDVVLYAKWDPLTVTYDANGASGGAAPSDSATYIAGQSVSVLSNSGKLVKLNVAGVSYRFAGWNTKSDGSGTDYAPYSALTMGTGKVVLYAKWVPYALRDRGPAGGWIFYIKSSYSDGWRYLEAASYGWYNGSADPTVQWGPMAKDENGDNSSIAPELVALGSGKNNSQWVYDTYGPSGANTIASYPAFQICVAYSTNGYSDWFLPSIRSLGMMYTNLHQGSGYTSVGGFSTGALNFYWSSSEVDANAAADQYFVDGTQAFNDSKNYSGSVRPVRAF